MSSASLSLKLFVVTTFITLIMYGLSLDQTYRYFRSYPKDALNLKFVIAALLLLDTLHVVCTMQLCYSAVLLAAEGQQSTEAILGLPFFWLLPITTTAVTVTVHYFFVRRVYFMSGRSCLFVLMTGSALCGAFGFSIASAFYISKLKQITYNRVIITALGELSILIALSLFVNAKLIFHLHKARTAIASTNSMIDRLIKFSVHTGVISSILGIVTIVLLLASPSLFFVPSIQLLAGFERNAVLAAVNSRRSMVDRGSNRVEIQTVDLDGAQETRRSAISWARQPGHPMDTVATVELGALPRGSNSSPEAGIEEPQKVGTAL